MIMWCLLSTVRIFSL